MENPKPNTRTATTTTRPQRRARSAALPAGAKLALKHIEAAESAYDEIYDDSWGAKGGKPVHSERSRRMFVKDAHETLFNDVLRAPEFLTTPDMCQRTVRVLVGDCQGDIPGGEVLTPKQRQKISRDAEQALVSFLEGRILIRCEPSAVIPIAEEMATIFKNRLVRIMQGFNPDGSRPRKPLSQKKFSEAVLENVLLLHTCLGTHRMYDYIHNNVSVEILDILGELRDLCIDKKVDGQILEYIRELVDNELKCKDTYSDVGSEEDESGDEGEEFSADSQDEDDEDDDDDFEACVEEEDEEEEKEMIRRAQEEEAELDDDLATEDGEDEEEDEEDDDEEDEEGYDSDDV